MRMKLVLASLSPRRKQLLKQVGVECEIRGAKVDERLDPGLTPAENAEALALKKARAVAPQAGGAAVLAADTLVVAGGRVLGKPRDEEEAQRMLMTLQGGWHEVVTGYALVLPDETERSGSAVTRVCFAKMTPGAVRRYIREYRPMDKAGAYGIQDGMARYIRGVEGCFYNVMGLPIERVCRLLEDAGVIGE
jgi:septum formation protein